jgi:metal-responsive CopG/Arc/MetJ family transcriptional regulator
MAARKVRSSLLTLRIDGRMANSLSREARRRSTTRSEVVRSILASALQKENAVDPIAEEARRQSLLVQTLRSEKEALDFTAAAADVWDWK